MSQKNIVFITADQLAASYIGCYGSGVNSTPTLDALAAQGARFERCYSTSPSCAPTRATILTGRSPAIHGIISNNYALSTDIPTFAHVLQACGYRTGGFGKFHQTPMFLEEPETIDFLGFDESAVTEDPKWGPWLRWVKEMHPEHYETALSMCWTPGQRPLSEAQMAAWKKAQQEILLPIKQNSEWGQMYQSPLPSELHDTTYMTNLGLDFIKRHVEEYGDKPFFCHISYVDPHDPYDPPAPYDKMFKPEDMKEPLPAEWIEDGLKVLDSNRNYINFRSICDNTEAIKKWRALFHGSLKFMDDQIARVIQFLKENNLWHNTIVIFTSDHGEMIGDHGLIAKSSPHYDNGIRCPLIVGGSDVRSGVTDRLTCTLDFYPSFCDWAAVSEDVRPPLEGKSFVGTCYGIEEPEPWHEVAVAIGDVQSVITADGWRLTLYTKSKEAQMFNLTEDPNEQRNLYKDPSYFEKRQELYERLVDVTTRPNRIMNYRNMPVVNGQKISPDHPIKIPVYQAEESPYLTGITLTQGTRVKY